MCNCCSSWNLKDKAQPQHVQASKADPRCPLQQQLGLRPPSPRAELRTQHCENSMGTLYIRFALTLVCFHICAYTKVVFLWHTFCLIWVNCYVQCGHKICWGILYIWCKCLRFVIIEIVWVYLYLKYGLFRFLS